MGEKKICVSVYAETADELVSKLRRAEKDADVIELRFDGLDPEGIRNAFTELRSNKQILLTLRPKEQGGTSTRNTNERVAFWTEYALHKTIDQRSIWIDQEHDLIPQKEFMFWLDQFVVVRSKHYFEGQTADLNKAYDVLVSDSEVAKIAVSSKDILDTIGIWKLLQRANDEGKRLIPIAMGESGKWTRILGPAYGAFLTYASLEAGDETAAGQVTVEDMKQTFRVPELDRDTSVYGIIAGNTSYSVSPWMHNAAFRSAGLNSVFVPLQTDNIEGFLTRMVKPDSREVELKFRGFSVTNPHKETIIPLLGEVDDLARTIGAVNTVKVEGGRLSGYNTDALGFISSLRQAYGDLTEARVALFGAGGAARACVKTLRDEGAAVTIFGRNAEKGQALAQEFGAAYQPSAGDRIMSDEFDIVVNATPLGMGTNSNFTVLTAPQLERLKLVYDLIYNPAETRLMREAKTAGVPAIGGLEMLIAQGAEQFRIWTGLEAPVQEMREAVEKRLAG
jgi:3-dehydroquinate dehydratase/shikimate dehydrogenase